MVVKNFNTSDPVPKSNFAPIPSGRYMAILWSDRKTFCKNGNVVLNLTFKLIDGVYKGSTVFHKNNFLNSNSISSAMGQRELLELTNSVNFKGSIAFDGSIEKLNESSLSEIHNKPLEIQVILEDNLQFGIQNKITGFFPRSSTPSVPKTQKEDTSFKTDTSKDLTSGWGARTT